MNQQRPTAVRIEQDFGDLAPDSGAASKRSDNPGGIVRKRSRIREKIGEQAQRAVSHQPDIDFMRRTAPFWDFLHDRYFRVEAHHWERVPQGPCLLVSVHGGTWLTMDAWMLCLTWWKKFGSSRVINGTAHDVLMALPGLGGLFRKLGVVPASKDSISACLAAGHSVAVWPGGEQDSMRSWRKRHEVVFGGRRGFVKQAILSGVPIVPVATVGGAETVFVLSEGRALARLLGLKHLLRCEMAPIVAGLPFGIWLEALPSHIPLPAKITMEFLDPVIVSHDIDRVDDDDYVNGIFVDVQRRIAAGVERLARQRKLPFVG